MNNITTGTETARINT